MANLRLSLFLLPLLSRFHLSHGSSLDDACSSSSCRAGGLLVRFPFRLVDKQNQSCGYPGFDLSCDDQGRTVMNLTESGEFIVDYIDYRKQTINLRDPNGCTPRRLTTFSTLGSAFRVESYRNITLSKCPPYAATLAMLVYFPVPCLSDNFYSVVIGPVKNGLTMMTGCWDYMTMAIPFVYSDTSDPLGIIGLTWDHPACGSCEEIAGRCRRKNKETLQITCNGDRDNRVIFIVMALLLIILMVLCNYVLRRRRPCGTNSRPSQDPVLAATTTTEGRGQQQQRVDRNGTGMDSPALASYPKMKISEKVPSQLRGSGDDDACPICLLDYRPSDTVKIIPECDHYFHEDCLDRWLRTKATCPLCRMQQLRSTDPGIE
ncbi:hypothetical protein MLD38_038594 [Melastoma candidum]|nr:hypothetical protein MLD38_038594 [Melastoma candidum]